MRFALAAIIALSCCPAWAGATPWQELAPDVRARLVSTDTLSDGRTAVGLELQMPAGTKTYWRVPGETGIPARLDFSASDGITGHVVHWPLPTREKVRGYMDYVYHGTLVLPVQLAVGGDTARVDLDVTLGVCSDICIPASARFQLTLDFSRPDRAQAIRINQALAAVPLAWTGEPAPIGAVRYEPTIGLWLEIDDSRVDLATLIADAGPEGPLFGAPQKSRDAGIVLFPLVGTMKKEGFAGSSVTITFTTSDGPFEAVRQVQ